MIATVESESAQATEQEWLERGQELAVDDAASQQAIAARQFAIGDWLNEGENRWNRRKAYDDAARIFPNYIRATLRDFAYVARGVKTSSRNDVLSWAHHKAVARLAETPEVQKELLANAAGLEMPLQKFRSHVSKKHPNPVAKSGRPFRLLLELPTDTRESFLRLALELGDEPERAGLRALQWILQQPNIAQKLREAAT